jgi:glycosyltransferase involved in cell wall biosynthesis
MSKEVAVSICIPTYNGQEYLSQCIDSCINQTFRDFEIVICDDGSTDNSVAIIEKYLDENTPIRLIKNETNLGLVGNWNKCIEQAKGQWIKFVFQDDYLTRDCLLEFVANIKENVQFITCERNFVLTHDVSEATRLYYEQGVRTLKNTNQNKLSNYSSSLISKIATRHIAMNFIAEPSLFFFRKDIVNSLGFFNADLKQLCDLEFALRIATNYGLVYIPKKLCAFRIHSQSTTNTNAKSYYFQMRYIEPLLLSYFLLFDKHYETFRKNLSFLEITKLKLSFKVKAYNAWLINSTANYSHSIFKNSSKFSEIRKIEQGNFFIKLIAWKFR